MKRLLFAAALATTGAAIAVPALASDLAVSVSVGQPGFYGRLDLGGYPPPQLIYQQPMAIERVPVGRPPVYLNVPPGHARHWRQHCGAYNACGERVYFVQNGWYKREYVPRYHEYQHDRGDEYRHDPRRGYANKHHGGGHDQGRDR